MRRCSAFRRFGRTKPNQLKLEHQRALGFRLRRRFADRLFAVDLDDEVVTSLGIKLNRVFILVLVDHKSTEDPQTLVQMLGYIVRIWEKSLSNDQPLVPVLPWVIYNGVGRGASIVVRDAVASPNRSTIHPVTRYD